MVDFNDIRVNRLIIHTIQPKQHGQDTASAQNSDTISLVNDSIMDLIRKSMIDAAGKGSKTFELGIENTGEHSFFDLTTEIYQHPGS
jgi:hypothetical protein